jgi:hypothetical protein
LHHFRTDGSLYAPAAPRLQDRAGSAQDVDGDGICDGVAQDELWGQSEEGETFLGTLRCGISSGGTDKKLSGWAREDAYQVCQLRRIGLLIGDERSMEYRFQGGRRPSSLKDMGFL